MLGLKPAASLANVLALTGSHPRRSRLALPSALPLPPIPGYPSIPFYFTGLNKPPITWKDGEECDSSFAWGGGGHCCSLTTADVFVKFAPLWRLSLFVPRHVFFSFS